MKVLIFHPVSEVLGGAELVLIHTMNSLLKDPANTVHLLSFKPLDLKKVEEFSGIKLPADRVFSVPTPLPDFLKSFPETFFLLKVAFLQRKAKAISSQYDLCVSTYNEIDFGVRGLQYIHCPMFAPHKLLHRYKIVPEKSLINRYPYLSWVYGAFIKLISGNRQSRIVNNVSMANSAFMQSVVKEAYGITPQVVYPSLVDLKIFKSADASKRARRIVAIGRLSSDKYMLELIDLYAAIHDAIPDLELVIAGKITDLDYYSALLARAAELNVPVRFATNLSNEQLFDLLKTSLFYINPKPFEHFGIATLEAVAAGCIPLVHKSGGSIEIVPALQLQFVNKKDLVYKIDQLLTKDSLKVEMLSLLEKNLHNFAPEVFYKQIEKAVATLNGQQSAQSEKVQSGLVTSTDLTTISAG